MRHRIERITILADSTIVQNTVTYYLRDGTQKQVRAIATLKKTPEVSKL